MRNLKVRHAGFDSGVEVVDGHSIRHRIEIWYALRWSDERGQRGGKEVSAVWVSHLGAVCVVQKKCTHGSGVGGEESWRRTHDRSGLGWIRDIAASVYSAACC